MASRIRPGKPLFQSTLPLRGATGADGVIHQYVSISIHTPLAGSDLPLAPFADICIISIHTPLAGSDARHSPHSLHPSAISIHTPLAGSDPVSSPSMT